MSAVYKMRCLSSLVCVYVQVSCGTFHPKTTWSRNWPGRHFPNLQRGSSSLCRTAETRRTCSYPPLRRRSSTTPQDASGAHHLSVSSLYWLQHAPLLTCISSCVCFFFSRDHILGTCFCMCQSAQLELLPHPSLFTVVFFKGHSRLQMLWCSLQRFLMF